MKTFVRVLILASVDRIAAAARPAPERPIPPPVPERSRCAGVHAVLRGSRHRDAGLCLRGRRFRLQVGDIRAAGHAVRRGWPADPDALPQPHAV